MSSCPQSSSCSFYSSVESSLVRRLKFASAFPYCKGGKHDLCAVHRRVAAGLDVPDDMHPDGSSIELEGTVVTASAGATAGSAFLVVEDSPVFATIAANAIRQHISGAHVEICSTFAEADSVIRTRNPRLVVSGYGIDGGKTVLDIRRLTPAPILVFTGRMGGHDTMPDRSHVVQKGAGPEAFHGALDVLLAT